MTKNKFIPKNERTKRYVYILQDPITDEVRYVGITETPSNRYYKHITYGKYKKLGKTKSSLWIRELLNINLKPIMTIIDEISIHEEWEWLEKYWISQFKTWGCNLTNISNGGKCAFGGGELANKPITVFDRDGVIFKYFESSTECAKYFKVTIATITGITNSKTPNLLKRKYQIKKGVYSSNIDKFEYKTPEHVINGTTNSSLYKSVICVEDDLTFPSLTKAAKYYNTNTCTIYNLLIKKYKTPKFGKTFNYA